MHQIKIIDKFIMQHNLSRQSIKHKLLESCFGSNPTTISSKPKTVSVSQQKKIHLTIHNKSPVIHRIGGQQKSRPNSALPINYIKSKEVTSRITLQSQSNLNQHIQKQSNALRIIQNKPMQTIDYRTSIATNATNSNVKMQQYNSMKYNPLPQRYQVLANNSLPSTTSLASNIKYSQASLNSKPVYVKQEFFNPVNCVNNKSPPQYTLQKHIEEKPSVAPYSIPYSKQVTKDIQSNQNQIETKALYINDVKGQSQRPFSPIFGQRKQARSSEVQQQQNHQNSIKLSQYIKTSPKFRQSSTKLTNTIQQSKIQKKQMAIGTDLTLNDLSDLIKQIQIKPVKVSPKMQKSIHLPTTSVSINQESKQLIESKLIDNNQINSQKSRFFYSSSKRVQPSEYQNYKRRQYYLQNKYNVLKKKV